MLGVAAEWNAYELEEIRHWLPDLVVGWAFLGCGLVAWSRRRESRTGPLLAATGFAWFAGSFAEPFVFLHRGPLVHCVLAFPSGGLRSRLSRAVVVAAYVTALVAPLRRSEIASIVLAPPGRRCRRARYLQAVGRERRARLQALQAASALGLGLAGVAAGRLALPDAEANEGLLLACEATLVAVAVGLLIGLLRAPWERAAVTDLVVELGDVSSGTLRDALARALGDPTLRVGYWLAETGAYVDGAGGQIELPNPVLRVPSPRSSGMAVRSPYSFTTGLFSTIPGSSMVSPPQPGSPLRTPASRPRCVSRLQTSRPRGAGCSRRATSSGAGSSSVSVTEQLTRLEALGELLATARPAPGSASSDHFGKAERQLARALYDLHELALGLHPRELVEKGLEGAVKGLAVRARCPSRSTSCRDGSRRRRRPPPTSCARKRSRTWPSTRPPRGSRSESSEADGRLAIEVADDGVGGADPARGFGLRGLADRVEALGGTLRVDSPPGGGTRIEATIPLEPARAGSTPRPESGRIG